MDGPGPQRETSEKGTASPLQKCDRGFRKNTELNRVMLRIARANPAIVSILSGCSVASLRPEWLD